MAVKFPETEVQLVGGDGNVFSIIGAVRRALKNDGHHQAAEDFAAECLNCDSYDSVLQLTLRTVKVK